MSAATDIQLVSTYRSVRGQKGERLVFLKLDEEVEALIHSSVHPFKKTSGQQTGSQDQRGFQNKILRVKHLRL